MKISISSQSLLEAKAQTLVLFLFEEKPLSQEVLLIDKELGGTIQTAIKEEKFTAKKSEAIIVNTGKGFGFNRVLFLGLGEKSKLSPLALRQGIGTAVKMLAKSNVHKIAVYVSKLPGRKLSAVQVAESLSLGALTAEYQFTEYKTVKKDLPTRIKELTFYTTYPLKAFNKGIEDGVIIANAINHARDYGNQPSNKANPSYLVRMAQEIAKTPKVRCRVLEREEMKKKKMEALLAVSQGAVHPPKFIILEYKGKPASKDWLVLVGKGITFDSGGISIKPGEKMDEMKFDMAGGGAVISAVEAIAHLKLTINVVALIPATENLPSGEAYKPGDIIGSAAGKTIEVINTDAEGRLILADALHYAKQYKPKAVVDFATLTGACVSALGTHVSGLMGNNSSLIQKIKQAGEISGDRVWELPLWEEYSKQMKSDIADLRNISTGQGGGAITAAAFLLEFIKEYSWAHLDIAGTAWSTEEKPYLGKGATGTGVALAVELARKWK
ncbi:leucyl aminopeptidase [Patescibacteria group bacterium]|nr:leucyl aminopeptidase [Patescibacteria group bacterium]